MRGRSPKRSGRIGRSGSQRTRLQGGRRRHAPFRRRRSRDPCRVRGQRTARSGPGGVAAATCSTRTQQGTRILIVEPIARRMATWWSGWEKAFAAAGGTSRRMAVCRSPPRTATPAWPRRRTRSARAHGQIPLALTPLTVFVDHDQFRSRPVVRRARFRPRARSTLARMCR